VTFHTKEALVKLLNRALMTLALLGVAGAAHARGGVAVGNENCGSPRLSQSIGKRFRAVPTPNGTLCVPFDNDAGVVTAITFQTNAPLQDLDVLPTSLLRRMRIDRERRRITLFDGEVRGPHLSIIFSGVPQPVWVIVRRYKATPGGASEP
jgi:hypothetical protein